MGQVGYFAHRIEPLLANALCSLKRALFAHHLLQRLLLLRSTFSDFMRRGLDGPSSVVRHGITR